ncbi:MAG: iron uptake porin [Desertifilum sp.]|nr:iron uptake porin [Desertifilum sp.]
MGVSLEALAILGTVGIISPVAALEFPLTEELLENAIANRDSLAQITSVSNLSDVQPTDWAFQALESLMARYGCLSGYPDNTYRGNRALTRYEFAAGVNACLDRILTRISDSSLEVSSEDWLILNRLQEDFAVELAALQTQVDRLETQVNQLENQQFSPIVRLNTSVVFAGTDLIGDRADANPDTQINSNFALNYRMRFNLVSSFTGRDRLMVRLQSSNRVPNFSGVSGTEMTRLSFEVGNTNDRINLNLLEYRFPIGDRLNLYLYGNAASHHFYTNVLNPYFASFGGAKGSPSRFSERNPIYRIGFLSPGGAAANYQFSDAVRLDFGYLTDNLNNPTAGAGLFNGSYSALGQLTVRPTSNLNFAFTYVRNYAANGNLLHRTGSEFSNTPFGLGVPLTSNSYGLQALWRMTPRFAVSGWFGYTQANRVDGRRGQADAINYAVNLAFPDLFKDGAVGGVGFGMPPKVIRNTLSQRQDPDTGFHLEAFYEYPLNRNIKLIPGVMYLVNPDHNAANGNIFVGTFRTVFNF